MMLVALHDAVALADGDARAIVCDRARAAGFEEVEFVQFGSAIDLADRLSSKTESPVDLVVIPYELKGLSGIGAVTEARAAQPGLNAIVVSDSPSHAAEAARAGIEGYLAEPVSSDGFARVLDRLFSALRSWRDASVLISTRSGSVRVGLDDIVYCETFGHDQLVHLLDRRTLSGRYSSLALFDLLACDERFFKVGSSYIVNLHEVSSLHTPSGDLSLADGTAIPVPQRLRKSMEEALLAQR